MINNVVLMGNLTKDVYYKESEKGVKFASFPIAVNGFKEDDTSYFTINVFGASAEACNKVLKSGWSVIVTGYLHTRSAKTKEGSKLFITEVIANNVTFVSAPKPKEEKTEEPETFIPDFPNT